MNTRPYRIYAASQKSDVTKALTSAIEAWVSDWMTIGLSPVAINVISLPDQSYTDINWLSHQGADNPLVAIGHTTKWISQLRTLLLGDYIDVAQTAAAEAMMKDLSLKVLQDLAHRIIQTSKLPSKTSLDLKPARLSHIFIQSGSAYIILQVILPLETAVHLLLSPEIVDAILGGKSITGMAVVTPILNALESERIVLEAIIGEGELTLDELRTLTAGDVIPLHRRVDQEIVLQIDSDTPVCSGFLASVHGRLAVQLK